MQNTCVEDQRHINQSPHEAAASAAFFVPLHRKINRTMKVKVSKEEIQRVLDDPEQRKIAKVNASDPWWVIALKVIAYLIGLLLAGTATAAAAQTAATAFFPVL